MHQQLSGAEVDQFAGQSFGEEIAFTTGGSYILGFFLGLGEGIKNGMPKNSRMPRRLIMNNFFNSVGKSTCRYGNGFAAAGLLYHIVGNSLNFLFEDQLE